MLVGDGVQHKDFNGFLAWNSDVPKSKLGLVVEQALDFAAVTGLGKVQGILLHLAEAVAEGRKEESANTTKVATLQRPRLDARRLVDPAGIQHHSAGSCL